MFLKRLFILHFLLVRSDRSFFENVKGICKELSYQRCQCGRVAMNKVALICFIIAKQFRTVEGFIQHKSESFVKSHSHDIKSQPSENQSEFFVFVKIQQELRNSLLFVCSIRLFYSQIIQWINKKGGY